MTDANTPQTSSEERDSFVPKPVKQRIWDLDQRKEYYIVMQTPENSYYVVRSVPINVVELLQIHEDFKEQMGHIILTSVPIHQVDNLECFICGEGELYYGDVNALPRVMPSVWSHGR